MFSSLKNRLVQAKSRSRSPLPVPHPTASTYSDDYTDLPPPYQYSHASSSSDGDCLKGDKGRKDSFEDSGRGRHYHLDSKVDTLDEACPGEECDAEYNRDVKHGRRHQNAKSALKPSTSTHSSKITSSGEDESLLHWLPQLAQFDTVIVVDDSGSMTHPCGFKREHSNEVPSRWQIVKELIGEIAQTVAKYDSDGIDVYFLNNDDASAHNLKTRREVEALFRGVVPGGATYTGRTIDHLFRQYRQEAQVRGVRNMKKMNYVVFTDGEASDAPVLTDSIVRHARWLDSERCPMDQVGVQFFQIGNDQKATKFLARLDDGLKQLGIRDIVDATRYEGASLSLYRTVKICVGGFDKEKDEEQLDEDE